MYYIQGSYCQQDLIFYRDQYHIITGKSSKNDQKFEQKRYYCNSFLVSDITIDK